MYNYESRGEVATSILRELNGIRTIMEIIDFTVMFVLPGHSRDITLLSSYFGPSRNAIECVGTWTAYVLLKVEGIKFEELFIRWKRKPSRKGLKRLFVGRRTAEYNAPYITYLNNM